MVSLTAIGRTRARGGGAAPASGRRVAAAVAVLSLATVLAAPAASASPAPTRSPVLVSLSFDDARVSQAMVEPLLAARHLRATFFVITRSVDTGNDPESLTWAQLHRLARDGHEIAGHTRTHPSLPTLSPDRQRDEICGSRSDLVAHGFHPTSFAYPYGDFDATTERITRQCGFANGRAARGGTEAVPPADRYAVKTLPNVTTADTVAHLESYLSGARPGEWLNYVFHDVGDGPGDGDAYRISARNFTAFVDWLARQRRTGRVVVRTIGDVVR